MKFKFDTLCVKGGYTPKTGEPVRPPIVQCTTFYYEKSQEMADLFDLKADGYFYSRLANPTVAALEAKISALEGGVQAIGCSSGMSAETLTTMTLTEAGDNILCAGTVYGGTYNLFNTTLPRFGIECRFFDVTADEKDIEKLIDDRTRFIFVETIANPAVVVVDFDKISAICKKYGLLFIVDNTLASPALCRPFEHGANIIIHSSTKYIDGHAAALGGIIVDGGNFEFKGNPRYKAFNEPDESYHGLVYSDIKNGAFAVKCRAQLIRDVGAIMSPMNAYLTDLGLDTLALRMERHSKNGIAVAKFLESHPKIEWVNYSGLESSPYYPLAQKYLPKGQGGMLTFGVKGGVEEGIKMIEAFKLISQETHVADSRTCVLQPSSTTHRQLSAEDLEKAGVPVDLIRLSVGLEDVDDIIADLDQALQKI